ncbi:MAG TPA: STAS domain-containing protein [Acidimicrobiales bacterium]|nr:STAS domain-containing protein [Acidimicrobiales bacterium]
MTLPFVRSAKAQPASPASTLDRASRSSSGPLSMEWAVEDRCVVCRPVGAIDAFSVSSFREAVAAVPSGASLVVDLSGVSFLDSAGLGALIGGIRRLRQLGGEVAVAAPRPLIARVLNTTGFDRIVEVSETVERAVEVLGGVLTAAGAGGD